MKRIDSPAALDAALRTVWALHPDEVDPAVDTTALLDRRTADLLARVAPELRGEALAHLSLMRAAADGMLPPDTPEG
jgi:hypothetical protein